MKNTNEVEMMEEENVFVVEVDMDKYTFEPDKSIVDTDKPDYRTPEYRRLLRENLNYFSAIQATRVRLANQLQLKLLGYTINGDSYVKQEYYNLSEPVSTISILQRQSMMDTLHATTRNEKIAYDTIHAYIIDNPYYALYLKYLTGVGVITSAVIISTYDSKKCPNPGKFIKYAGQAPIMGIGRLTISKSKFRKKLGQPCYELLNRNGSVHVVFTPAPDHPKYKMVRVDRENEGYVNQFNKKLKSKMSGVLFECMIKANSAYKIAYYDTFKERKSKDTNLIQGRSEKNQKRWCDASLGELHKGGKRVMGQKFIADMVAEFKKIDGEPIPAPYSIAKLGHSDTPDHLKANVEVHFRRHEEHVKILEKLKKEEIKANKEKEKELRKRMREEKKAEKLEADQIKAEARATCKLNKHKPKLSPVKLKEKEQG